jgi:diacylglycerol kinase (ATP)
VGQAVVLYNPVAGRGRAQLASEKACAALRRRGLQVDRQPTTGPGSATALARQATGDVDLVVVAGGDGSVRETLVGLGRAAERIPVGVIPCGNANVIARELQIPLSIEASAALLESGSPIPIDVGFADDEMFLAMIGIGWDARTTRNIAALRATRPGNAWYRVWADSVYVAAGLAALLSWPPDRLRLVVDGQSATEDYCAAVIANQATYGKGWSLVPDAHIQDGRLAYQARKRFGFPFVACQLVAGILRTRVPAFVSDYGSGMRISVQSDRPFPLHVDGDFRGWRTTLDLRVQPAAARLLAPVEPSRHTEPRKTGGL